MVNRLLRQVKFIFVPVASLLDSNLKRSSGALFLLLLVSSSSNVAPDHVTTVLFMTR